MSEKLETKSSVKKIGL